MRTWGWEERMWTIEVRYQPQIKIIHLIVESLYGSLNLLGPSQQLLTYLFFSRLKSSLCWSVTFLHSMICCPWHLQPISTNISRDRDVASSVGLHCTCRAQSCQSPLLLSDRGIVGHLGSPYMHEWRRQRGSIRSNSAFRTLQQVMPTHVSYKQRKDESDSYWALMIYHDFTPYSFVVLIYDAGLVRWFWAAPHRRLRSALSADFNKSWSRPKE